MKNQGAQADPLSEFGLNNYEASVYRALVAEGISTAKDVSHATSVPYGKVYEIIKALSHKGFAAALPTKPAKFKAVPPAEAIAAAKRRLVGSIDLAQENALRELARASAQPGEAAPGSGLGDFLLIERRSAVHDKIGLMLEKARANVRIVASENGLKRLAVHRKALQSAHRRGASITVASSGAAAAGKSQALSFCRLVDAGPASQQLISVDGEECIMFRPVPDDDSVLHGKDLALWIGDPAFASFLEGMFDSSFGARQAQPAPKAGYRILGQKAAGKAPAEKPAGQARAAGHGASRC